MKHLVFLGLMSVFLVTGCYTYTPTQSNNNPYKENQQKIQDNCDSFKGKTKKTLLLNWGPPITSTSDGEGGEVLTYSNAVRLSYGTYRVTVHMYINSSGVVYACRVMQSVK